MSEIAESELVVVGAGPGGYAAAFLAADKGMKVTLIDGSERPGGTCLHVGCIPSKALLHTAKLITDAREGEVMGVHFPPPKIDIAGVRSYWMKVVDTLSKNLAELARRRKVEYLRARAKFVDSQTLELNNGSRRRFRHCILATGSTPSWPAALRLDSPRVMDSTGALKLEDVPRSLLVVGGGYIGLELGYVYAALGSKVTVVEMMDGLLPGVDRDLVKPLHGRLAKLFDKIYLSTRVLRLEDTGKGIKAILEGPEVAEREPIFDRVLVAVGRRPASQGLGLEKTRVQVDEKGFVKVDEQRRTTDEHIYAIGDVAGEPMLAHKATHEGKVAVEAIAGEKVAYEPRCVPAVVFTDPEIAWCGLTETEAQRQKREVKVARFPWAASGRAMTLGRTEGLTKLLVDPATDVVLGVGIVGADAGELIGEGVLAVEMAASARDLALSIHPHPTLTETLAEGAETVHGMSTHLYRPRKEEKVAT
ncbi:MAG TPA: dihydrolipoyl dehydrogenase [Gemmataceae bacterium]|nr:dihydrolipoyl dehydrogenase [Gemmataceae bacterium]